jgi:hypothetical protein
MPTSDWHGKLLVEVARADTGTEVIDLPGVSEVRESTILDDWQ